LVEQKVISQSEFEQAQQAYLSAKANYEAATDAIAANEANVRSAQASLSRANKDVSRTTIAAPMDGVVSLLLVKKGERVVGTAQMAGTEMMRIADLKSIEAQVDVGENDIPKVKYGDTALVEVDAFSNRKFKGVVYKIANPESIASQTSGSTSNSTQVTNYQVHVRLLPSTYQDLIAKGQPFPFRPNMSASADIQTSTHKNVLAVPLNAVTTRDKNSGNAPASGDQNSNNNNNQNNDVSAASSSDENIEEVVFVVQKDGIVRKKPVKTDIQDINYIEIKSGISNGDQVVTGPYDIVSKQLKDSTKVKVVPKDQLVQSFKTQ
jgi:HlyD family secretion protein